MQRKSSQKTLTRKDIKGAVIEALSPFAQAVQTDFRGVNKRLDKVDSRLDGVDVRLGGFETSLGGVETRLGKVEFELQEVKTDVREMKERSSELFEKLDKFITLYEKQGQELLMLGAQVRRLEERVIKLETNQKRP